MQDFIGGLFGLFVVAAMIGLFLAAIVWAFFNVWLVLGIFAAIIVLLIIYGMATSENELISGLTLMSICIPVLYVLYLIAN